MKNLLMTTFVLLCAVITSWAQEKYVPCKGEIAFEGFDLVSYFQKGGPVEGKSEFKTEYDGLILFFSSKTNKEKFDQNPEAYMPAYGGYCATAVALKRFVEPNFKHFLIQNNKLMFFEVKGFFNGKTQWQKDPDLNEVMANKYYEETFEDE